MILKTKLNGAYHAFFCKGCDDFHVIPANMWEFNNDYVNPTFSPSLLLTRPSMVCHSFIRNGFIEYLDDCTHALANTTVKLEEFPHKFYFSGEMESED